MVAEQLQHTGIKPRAIVLEPLGRNTAPAIAVAAHIALRDDPDALLLVLPSDDVVQNVPAFMSLTFL
ncbi:sugar phosphate nucleotidyltransferase [Burkholderia sp. Ac-20344]|uniref:sugar phosphate nucleotidyltransferase n=1 Tax=Burkholderia sp. Ac-20344 TaxID=2703890 RepID=UPI001F11AC80|nr:sugar phosphate nucleotidyltransferase [Burkholderia sp. Ac-20344]